MSEANGHMCAALLRGPGDLQLSSVARPVPQPGEVLLKVLAAGVCQTDVHIRHATDSRTPDGTILGHEIAGEIVELGAGVLEWTTGERVVVHPCWSCGKCRTCMAGRENECRATGGRLQPPMTPGVTTNGGMAAYVVAPARTLFPIGDLDPALAAPLTDAGLTPYHAIMSCRELLTPGSTVVVIGLGGLGNMALQILRALTASRIVAMDRSQGAMDASREWADAVLSSDETAVQSVLDMTGGYGADVVLDFVGIDATMQMAVEMIGRGGAIRVVGLSGGTYTFMARSAGNPLPRGVTIMCPYSGTYNDLSEVLALARAGAIRPIVNRFSLTDALSALDKLQAGEIQGRAVLVPGA
ncbi:alcohol dehydrogenase, propanol-preferring [Faunimonas pinastri]|uniref:Alcohol dehydrogenase, propanol-preferring n=1 Tax=Faunimonas pinastri TaxID=1855383 RepID=A0A1H9K995_9HYPH|nr:NAD(P)-dependent alcohol dehydrogenase [Faunimonas pinastri]SEQ95720.1 alcohol dehydrogenase, propanol-preferring [Faunimonas pinastri]